MTEQTKRIGLIGLMGLIGLIAGIVLVWKYRNMGYPQKYTITEVADHNAAMARAYAWVAEDPQNRAWTTINNTGSMQAKFGDNSICLLRKSDGSDIEKGDLVYYTGNPRFKEGTNTLHEVAALNKTHFIGNGVSNKHYDGWSARAGIKWKADVVKWPVQKGALPGAGQPPPAIAASAAGGAGSANTTSTAKALMREGGQK